MTTITTQDDLLRALRDNPAWRSSVQAQIIGQDLMNLPALMAALSDLFAEFVADQKRFNQSMTEFVADQKQFNALQSQRNQRHDARLHRMESDIGQLKGEYARTRAIDEVLGIAEGMGLTYVRTLSRTDLAILSRGHGLVPDVLQSFLRADLVMETQSGQCFIYVPVEVSFTADRRDTGRVIRNAELISQFTGRPARAAIASVRNDQDVMPLIESGAVYWHQLEDRTPNPE